MALGKSDRRKQQQSPSRRRGGDGGSGGDAPPMHARATNYNHTTHHTNFDDTRVPAIVGRLNSSPSVARPPTSGSYAGGFLDAVATAAHLQRASTPSDGGAPCPRVCGDRAAQNSRCAREGKKNRAADLLNRLLRRGRRSRPDGAADELLADGQEAATATTATAKKFSAACTRSSPPPRPHAQLYQERSDAEKQKQNQRQRSTPAAQLGPVAVSSTVPWERVRCVVVKSLANDSDEDDDNWCQGSNQRGRWGTAALPTDEGASVRRSRSVERCSGSDAPSFVGTWDEGPRRSSSSRDIVALYTSGCLDGSPHLAQPSSRMSTPNHSSTVERIGHAAAMGTLQQPSAANRFSTSATDLSASALPERGWSFGTSDQLSPLPLRGSPQPPGYGLASSSEQRSRSFSETRTAIVGAAAAAASAAAAAATSGVAEKDVISINGVRVLAPGYFSRPRRALSSNDIAVENLRLWVGATQERQQRQQHEQLWQQQQQWRRQQQWQQQQEWQYQQQRQWQEQQQQQQQRQQHQNRCPQHQQQQLQPLTHWHPKGESSLPEAFAEVIKDSVSYSREKEGVGDSSGGGGGVENLLVLETDRYEEARIEELLGSSHSLREARVPMLMVARHSCDAGRWSSQDELQVESGEVVLGLYRQNEWLRVRTHDGREGFVPYAHTRPLRQPASESISQERRRLAESLSTEFRSAASRCCYSSASDGVDLPGDHSWFNTKATFGALRDSSDEPAGRPYSPTLRDVATTASAAVADSALASRQSFHIRPPVHRYGPDNTRRGRTGVLRRMLDDSSSYASSDDSVFRATPQRSKHRDVAATVASSTILSPPQPPRPRRPSKLTAARAESTSLDDGADVVHSDSGISEPASVRSEQCGSLPVTATVLSANRGSSTCFTAVRSFEAVGWEGGNEDGDVVNLSSSTKWPSATYTRSPKHCDHSSLCVCGAVQVGFGDRCIVGCRGSSGPTTGHRSTAKADIVRHGTFGGRGYSPLRPDIPRNFDGPVVAVTYSYAAINKDDISVRTGETVRLLNADDLEWVWVQKHDEREGFVPRQYVQIEDSVPIDFARHRSTAV